MSFRTITILTAFVLVASGGAAWAADGAATFGTKCAGCHGADGKADTKAAQAMKVPALAGDAHVAGMTEEQVVETIKANPKHKGAIASLSEDDFKALASHVKGLAGSGGAEGGAASE